MDMSREFFFPLFIIHDMTGSCEIIMRFSFQNKSLDETKNVPLLDFHPLMRRL